MTNAALGTGGGSAWRQQAIVSFVSNHSKELNVTIAEKENFFFLRLFILDYREAKRRKRAMEDERRRSYSITDLADWHRQSPGR